MQRDLVAAILVGLVCAVMGTFVVLRGLAFIGDAVSHASFPGVVIAFIVGFPLYLGGADHGRGHGARDRGRVARRGRLRLDTSVGVLLAGCSRSASCSSARSTDTSPTCSSYLLGNVLGITFADIVQIAALGGVVLLVVALLRKELLYASFDPAGAAASASRSGPSTTCCSGSSA